MTIMQAIVAICVAIIGSAAATLGFVQFLINRKDKKEENSVQKQIDDAVLKAKEEVYKELAKVSQERSQEGAQRFNTHAESFKAVNKQIEENTKQIGELTEISKNVLESVESLNKTVKTSTESQCNFIYDRLLIVGKKVLKNKVVTLSEKTNLKQLFESYRGLEGHDPYIFTMYEECMKLDPIPDDNERNVS